MNIQALGAPAAAKPEERQVQAAEQRGPVSAVAADGSTGAPEPSREDLSAAVKKINESMALSSQSLEFSIDDDTKDIVVKVIDQDTREVVRQMPSREALEIAKSLDRMRGLLLHQTA